MNPAPDLTRPFHIWLWVGAGFAVLLAALGWLSLNTLKLDRVQRETERQAEVEERTRLALWRMDSALTALIVEESARPASVYQPFSPAPRAYTKGLAAIQQGDVLVPSPLLGFTSSNIHLHFQFSARGPVTSPQTPQGKERDIAQTAYVSAGQIQTSTERLREFETLLGRPASSTRTNRAAWISSIPPGVGQPEPTGQDYRTALIRFLAGVRPGGNMLEGRGGPNLATRDLAAPKQTAEANQQVQAAWNQLEQSARFKNYESAQQRLAQNKEPTPQTSAPTGRTSEGVFTAHWLGEELILARKVESPSGLLVQGCWLNWAHVKQALLSEVRDLLPGADLRPVFRDNGQLQSRQLATVPASLFQGTVPLIPQPIWSPARIALLVAWICLALVGAAGVILLYGVVSLSERRAAFVSAVTHELRTPLTTFKMYSEMLAAGMVPDAARREQYLNTLCSEANRLTHLVENVLAYARLERGSARSRVERISLQALLEKVQPRLIQRAEQASLVVVSTADEKAGRTLVHVDVTAVEQILFNLVDNACKYAAPSAVDKTIHLEALSGEKVAMVRVRDHGQGISAVAARRLFQPFSKSAHEAAHTAPGVGLGLALCRRLSRSMGGDLRFDGLNKSGASFVLTLPLSDAREQKSA